MGSIQRLRNCVEDLDDFPVFGPGAGGADEIFGGVDIEHDRPPPGRELIPERPEHDDLTVGELPPELVAKLSAALFDLAHSHLPSGLCAWSPVPPRHKDGSTTAGMLIPCCWSHAVNTREVQTGPGKGRRAQALFIFLHHRDTTSQYDKTQRACGQNA